MQIGIGHRAGTDHAGSTFSAQLLLQNLHSVSLDLNILKLMVHLIAMTSAVTVDAAMCASTIEIKAILWRENGFIVRVMHNAPPKIKA